MKVKQACIPVLGLALAAAASPVSVLSRQDDDIHHNPERFCTGWDLRTLEGCKNVWHQTSAGVTLELFLKTHWEGNNNWLKNLGNEFTGGDPTELDDCANIDLACKSPAESCLAIFDREYAGVRAKDSFWIFRAVQGLHSKAKAIKAALLDQTVISGLNIPTMMSEFDTADDDGSEVFDWIITALGIATSIVGVIPSSRAEPVGLALDITSGLMGAMTPEEKEAADISSVQSALAAVYESSVNTLDKMVKVATGHGTEEEYAALPNTEYDDYETQIAKFFNGGRFLLDDDEEDVVLALDAMKGNIRYKMVDQALQSQGYFLVAYKHRTQAECGSVGRQWMLFQGEMQCFSLMKACDRPGCFEEASEETYNLMEKWGVPDRITYYTLLNECAASGLEAIDTGITGHLAIPKCFVNTPSKKLLQVQLDFVGAEDATTAPRTYTWEEWNRE